MFAEWRCFLSGYAARIRNERRSQAWTVSNLMMAAGVKPEAVTIDKLLGTKPRRTKTIEAEQELPPEEIFRRLRAEGEKQAAEAATAAKAKRKVKGGLTSGG